MLVRPQEYASLGGGLSNNATGDYSSIAGGWQNVAQSDYSGVGGGYRNYALSNYATVGGGFLNRANGRFATVVGGSRNSANGRYSFAAGYMAYAKYDNTAVFAFGNGNRDDGGCETYVDPNNAASPTDSTIQFCTEKFWMNGQDLVARIEEERRLSDDVDGRLKSISAQGKAIAEQEALLAEQRKQISSFQKIVAERQALIAQLSSSLL